MGFGIMLKKMNMMKPYGAETSIAAFGAAYCGAVNCGAAYCGAVDCDAVDCVSEPRDEASSLLFPYIIVNL